MSAPKTILLHLDDSADAVERVRVARHLAEAFEAHVSALYGVLPALPYRAAEAEVALAAGAGPSRRDTARLEVARATFRTGATGSTRLTWLEANGDALSVLARQALYADLVILGQRNPDGPGDAALPADFIPSLLIESGTPALVLPHTVVIAPIGRTVLVAWKETREAARALTAALPWLRNADAVHVVCGRSDNESASDRLLVHLASHGIQATAHPDSGDDRHAGERLLAKAAEVGADLLVMGCYGHSRAREWLLGGTTRTVLQSMQLPVLMAH